jgi:hypothetical protein
MLTRHAEVRCQQRGIRPEVIATLLEYGRRERRRGAEICFMDRSTRQRAHRELGHDAYTRLVDHLDRYLVVADDGHIITAAHRLKRLKF